MSDTKSQSPTTPTPEAPRDDAFHLEEHFDASKPHLEDNTEKLVEKAQERTRAQSDASYGKILQKVQSTQATDDTNVPQDADTLQQMTDRESQIQHLIDLASTKGVTHAVSVARHAEDYYVLDQLHDRLLAQDFHDALLRKGMIEEL